METDDSSLENNAVLLKHASVERKRAAKEMAVARKRAQQRVKDVRRGVTRQDKRTEASEGSRWRAAAVRREQAYERRRAGVGLKQAVGGGSK